MSRNGEYFEGVVRDDSIVVGFDSDQRVVKVLSVDYGIVDVSLPPSDKTPEYEHGQNVRIVNLTREQKLTLNSSKNINLGNGSELKVVENQR